MQRNPASRENARPSTHSSKSFTRYEPGASPAAQTRPSTNAPQQDPIVASPTAIDSKEGLGGDIFETGDGDDGPENKEETISIPHSAEELPIEIQSLMERFIESLSLKKHAQPITAEQLSELYQNFYAHCGAQIETHIAAIYSRLSRQRSPAPSVSSVSSSKSRGGRKNSKPLEAVTDEPLSDQQMLTTSEISDRRKQRRQLEIKRLALEDAVERWVCEKVYGKIWRHRTTDDQERDEKVRSRAAALALVGVDLKELLSGPSEDPKRRTSRSERPAEDPARAQLADARNHVLRMTDEKYPLGKLQALTAAHKSIVETLSQMFPSTTSADEVLPTLIYTIITLPPDEINVVSHLNFIQRFRAANKIDGETAYCLTNLEAAISFLENVDLSSLRPGEETSRSRSRSPPKDDTAPLYRGLPSDSPKIEGKEKEPPSSPKTGTSNRRLSNLLQSRPRALEAATGMVSSGADAAYDTIHNALDGSMKFFFGRMKEKQSSISSPSGSTADITVPKTLEDARKLVSTPPPLLEDDASLGGDSTHDTPSIEQRSKALELVTGKRGARDRSVESVRSSSSAQKANTAAASAQGSTVTSRMADYASVEGVRNLGSQLNPLKGLSAMGSFRGFGRQSNAASPTPSVYGHSPTPSDGNVKFDKAIDVSGIGAPIQKFVDCKEAKELNFYDVELLLRDYQRLSGALRALQGSSSSS